MISLLNTIDIRIFPAKAMLVIFAISMAPPVVANERQVLASLHVLPKQV